MPRLAVRAVPSRPVPSCRRPSDRPRGIQPSVANFSYGQCDNDRKLLQAAKEVMERILRAAGADEVVTIERDAHLVGGCRMAADERSGVVDRNPRTFAVPNLHLTDGSVLPAQGSANPALTIMALAARAADHLVAGARAGLRAESVGPA